MGLFWGAASHFASRTLGNSAEPWTFERSILPSLIEGAYGALIGFVQASFIPHCNLW
jgi:hypothetical protein